MHTGKRTREKNFESVICLLEAFTDINSAPKGKDRASPVVALYISNTVIIALGDLHAISRRLYAF